jgi:hypothetical protein
VSCALTRICFFLLFALFRSQLFNTNYNVSSNRHSFSAKPALLYSKDDFYVLDRFVRVWRACLLACLF